VRQGTALLVMLLAAGPARAQQAPCSVVANVVATDPSSLPKGLGVPLSAETWGQVLQAGWAADLTAGNSLQAPAKDLQAGAFVARDKRDFIPIESVETDRGTRRIVFVVDNGEPISLAARQVEAAAVRAVLSSARPEDSFALLTAGGPRVALPLGSSKDAIQAAVDGLPGASLKVREGRAVLKSIIEATTWFGSPQLGDSIFLLARSPKFENSRVDSPVQSALASRRIRLFTLGLYAMDWGSVWSPFIALGDQSGGGWEEVYPLPRKGGAKPASLRAARVHAKLLYEVAAEVYILRLQRTNPDTIIDLRLQDLAKMPWVRVIYPRPLPVCPPPTGGVPLPGQKKK